MKKITKISSDKPKQNAKKLRVAAYCRVSTDKSDQLNSLEAQKKFFTEYTEKNGHNLVRLYADEGISGTKTKNRKEFLRLMRDAQHGLFDMVVVKDYFSLCQKYRRPFTKYPNSESIRD